MLNGMAGSAGHSTTGPRNRELKSDDRQRIADAFALVGIPEARIFHAIESITQATVATAARRVRRRRRGEPDEIALM
jgi:hypothetical protein